MRAVAIAILLAGCSGEPCDKVTGICLNALIEGDAVGMLDQLTIAVDGLGTMSSPPNAGAQFSLPVRLAIGLPGSVVPSAGIVVTGVEGGRAVATSGHQSVPITPIRRASYTFTLVGGNVDGGNGDGPKGVDSPAVQTIPDVPRGGTSGKVTFTITNDTAMARKPTAIVESIMNGGPFSPDPSSTCPLTMTGFNPVAAMSSCTLVMTVKTDRSGTFDDTFTEPARLPGVARADRGLGLLAPGHLCGHRRRGQSDLALDRHQRLEQLDGGR
jgi:hypothetical protein